MLLLSSHVRSCCPCKGLGQNEVSIAIPIDEFDIPKEEEKPGFDYDEYFGDTPIYTMYMLIRQQVLAFPAYLCKSRLTVLKTVLTSVGSVQCFRTEELSQVDQPL